MEFFFNLWIWKFLHLTLLLINQKKLGVFWSFLCSVGIRCWRFFSRYHLHFIRVLLLFTHSHQIIITSFFLITFLLVKREEKMVHAKGYLDLVQSLCFWEFKCKAFFSSKTSSKSSRSGKRILKLDLVSFHQDYVHYCLHSSIFLNSLLDAYIGGLYRRIGT